MPYAIDDEEKEKRTSTDLRDLDLIPCAVTRRRILNHNSKETFSCELPYHTIIFNTVIMLVWTSSFSLAKTVAAVVLVIFDIQQAATEGKPIFPANFHNDSYFLE